MRNAWITGTEGRGYSMWTANYCCLLLLSHVQFSIMAECGTRGTLAIFSWRCFFFEFEKRQLWVRPIEWLNLNFESCVVHLTCFIKEKERHLPATCIPGNKVRRLCLWAQVTWNYSVEWDNFVWQLLQNHLVTLWSSFYFQPIIASTIDWMADFFPRLFWAHTGRLCRQVRNAQMYKHCLLYTSDAADE